MSKFDLIHKFIICRHFFCLAAFFWAFTFPLLAQDEDELLDLSAEQELHRNKFFRMFKYGMNRKIMESVAPENVGPGKQHLKSSRLSSFEYFKAENSFVRENTKEMINSYLKFYHHNSYIINPPNRYPKIETRKKVIPVLHFIDGQTNHYLLKRIRDDIYDLILLEYSPNFKQYSEKQIKSYSLDTFLENAKLAGNKVIRIGLYEEGSYLPPRLTNREIEIKPISIIKVFERNRMLAEARKKQKEKKKKKDMSFDNPMDMMLYKVSLIDGHIDMINKNTEKALKKKKELITMRLPQLQSKIAKIKTDTEINILVQNEIIYRIFNPDPKIEHCPGFIDEEGYCNANGEWNEKTWKLYRRLYKITDIAGGLFAEYAPQLKH
jgi:hypothetical protein